MLVPVNKKYKGASSSEVCMVAIYCLCSACLLSTDYYVWVQWTGGSVSLPHSCILFQMLGTFLTCIGAVSVYDPSHLHSWMCYPLCYIVNFGCSGCVPFVCMTLTVSDTETWEAAKTIITCCCFKRTQICSKVSSTRKGTHQIFSCSA